MIKEIKLKGVYINDTKKDGTPCVDKNGNPYKMIYIENTEGKKASMFCGKFQAKDLQIIQTWKAGDTVRVNLEKSGEYINFTIPSKTDEIVERVEKLEKAVFAPKTVQNTPKVQSATPAIETPPDAPQQATEGEISVDDLPF